MDMQNSTEAWDMSGSLAWHRIRCPGCWDAQGFVADHLVTSCSRTITRWTKALMLVDPLDNCGQAGIPVSFSTDGPDAKLLCFKMPYV